MIRTTIIALLLLAQSCAKKDAHPPHEEHAPRKEQPAQEDPPKKPDHGEAAPLGDMTLAGYTFELGRLGAFEPGAESAVTAHATTAPKGADWRRTNLYVWAEDASGARLSAPSKAIVEGGKLHLHVALRAGSAPAAVLVFRLREGEVDERTRLTLKPPSPGDKPRSKAPKHTHAKTPHDGVIARLGGDDGKPTSWLELKLHDDKGDLELWLTTDKAGKHPLDVPLATRPTVTFADHDDKTVTLAPRNSDKNEDEDGTPNLRDGKTQYFIYPGASGEDASWLTGKAFQSIVTVTVSLDGAAATSAEFVLQPHTHEDGHAE